MRLKLATLFLFLPTLLGAQTLQTFTGAGVSPAGSITATFRDDYHIWEKVRLNFDTLNTLIKTGTGSPEGVVTATVSAIYRQTDGIDGTTLWTKVSGSGNTGWLALQTSTTNIVRATVVTLTNAQIKALPTTAITLVAAPGVGYRIRLLAVSLKTNFTAGGYSNRNATYIDLHSANYEIYGPVDDSATTPPLTGMTTILSTAGEVVYDIHVPNVAGTPSAGAAGYVLNSIFPAKVDVDNVALTLAADNNGSGDFTGGNAANTLKVTIYWAKEAL